MTEKRAEEIRDRAILIVRLVTAGGALTTLGLTWLFSNLAVAYFSGKPPAENPPTIPVAAAPVQKPPKVIQTVVHLPYGSSGPRPPGQTPVPAQAPPPPPACHSTPSHPC